MKIIYPVNCREVNEDLGQDELIRRLKALAHTFQTLGQDSQEEGKYNDFKPLAHHLAEEFFLNHPSKDVQLLIACCIADILRIFAPEAPYVEPDEIKSVFYFLIRQLNGLRDPKDPAFKRYFYLLENLAYVKSFNMCFELPDESQQIFCQLFHTFFSIINDEHSHKVRNYMLEVMHPLVAESDQISDEWLNTIMRNIVEENKVSRNAYLLAKELVQKTSTVLQPFLQSFFNRELLLDSKGGGEPKKYAISERLYEFIYALNTICPDVLMSVVPQLEYKLRSADEKDRYGAVSLLARMFSERGSNLARDHRQLWNTFLGRFNDIKPNIRTKCVQYSMHFLLNHPELREDLVEALKSRQHDAEESVRYEVVTAIVSTARREYEIVAQSKELLSFVRERTLDKKFKIRREAMSGLAFVYKKRTILADGTIIPHQSENQDSLAWVKNKLLYGYYMNMLDDRLLVEKLLNTTLVPYQMRVEDRMLMMLSLVSTIDEKAAKAFAEIMKNRATVRRAVHKLLQVYSDTNLSESQKENELRLHVISLSKSLPDEIKAREFLMKFVHHMEDDTVLLNKMNRIVDPAVSCRECAEAVNMVLKKLGQPIMTNLYYNTVKSLLERASSVLVDDEAVKMLLEYILLLLRGTVDGNPVADLDGDPVIICTKGLQLLHLLATTQPQSFSNEEALRRLYDCIGAVSAGDTEEIHCLVLSIFAVLGKCTPIIRTCPDVYKDLLEFGIINIKHGTPKVAKHSVRAILANGDDDKEVDQQLLETIESIRENLDVENEFCRTALSAIGHIAVLAPQKFPIQIKNIISKRVVKELLMKQKKPTLSTSDDWCKEDALPEETRCKLEGLKVISRWLVGLKDERIFAKKTFRMLNAFIVNNGDLGLSQDFKLSEAEKSYLRLGAACCMLKICQQKGVGDEFNAEQFYNLSRLMADPVAEVRGTFFQKLHKGLSAGIPNNCLPLDFLGFYALCGLESNRQLRSMAKQQMIHNVNRRRDYIKSLLLHGGEKASEQLPHVLPDFVLVFGVPVLAHSSSFVDPTNVEQLMRMRNCLWFILEPVVTKNENFCFTFLKSLTDAMKVKVDAVDPTDDTTNHKLWALCDLALGLIMSKTANYETKEYLTEPRVPEIYFKTPARPIDDNINKPYLPEEVRLLAMRKPTVVGKVLAETPAPGRSGGGTSRTVMETIRDKDTLLASDEEAEASGGRPKRGGRLNKGDKRGRSDEDSEEEPFPRESPERQYSRNPANTYRVEEKDITLDEFGGSQASVSVPELLDDGHGADHDLEHGEDADGDEGLENEEESARPTRARRGPKAGPVKRGASKIVPEANGKKAKVDVPANNATARSTRRQQQQSGDVSDENVELEQASAKTAGKTKKAVPAKEPPLTSGTRTSGRLRR